MNEMGIGCWGDLKLSLPLKRHICIELSYLDPRIVPGVIHTIPITRMHKNEYNFQKGQTSSPQKAQSERSNKKMMSHTQKQTVGNDVYPSAVALRPGQQGPWIPRRAPEVSGPLYMTARATDFESDLRPTILP